MNPRRIFKIARPPKHGVTPSFEEPAFSLRFLLYDSCFCFSLRLCVSALKAFFRLFSLPKTAL